MVVVTGLFLCFDKFITLSHEAQSIQKVIGKLGPNIRPKMKKNIYKKVKVHSNLTVTVK